MRVTTKIFRQHVSIESRHDRNADSMPQDKDQDSKFKNCLKNKTVLRHDSVLRLNIPVHVSF